MIKNYTRYLVFLTLLYINNIDANILLKKPQYLSSDDIKVRVQKRCVQFTWGFLKMPRLRNIASCSFCYEHGKAGFALKIFQLPLYFYNYRLLPNWDEVKGMFNRPNYYLAKPLQIDTPKPKKISSDELVSFLKNKKCVFYTGAGLSACKVASMADLEQSLEINKGVKHFLTLALSNPKKVADVFDQFCKSAVNQEPTAAHVALKIIAEKKSTAIITENVDLLQHRTGIDPIFAYSDTVISLSQKDWQEVDAIICIGLSHDDRGLHA